MYPEGLTEMKKLSTNPQIKSADCGYRDYVYPTPTFLSHVLYIKKGSSGYTLDKCMFCMLKGVRVDTHLIKVCSVY